jgi:hypothetical protein
MSLSNDDVLTLNILNSNLSYLYDYKFLPYNQDSKLP